jgi:hypothetical protein
MKTKKVTQKKRVLAALLRGEEINRVWAAKQTPIIAQPTNVCGLLIKDKFPIMKMMVYPEGGGKYMNFWMTQSGIDYVRNEARKRIKELIK